MIALAVLLGSATAAGAGEAIPVRPGPWYVAIGASEAVGVQPVPWDRHGVRTDQGYADDLTRREQSRWPGLRLVDFGCPGITAQGALDGDGACRYVAGSEVATAVDFIKAHEGDVAFVTVDLGFNDIWPCLVHHTVDEACVDAALSRISTAIPSILAELRAAGGPDLVMVGLQHADPYVADALFGHVGFAQETVGVFDRLNDALAAAYTAAGAVVAHAPASRGRLGFHAVLNACANTWMCTDHNIHPTPAGYRVIAHAVAAAIAGAGATAAGQERSAGLPRPVRSGAGRR